MREPLPPNEFKITCDVRKFWIEKNADGKDTYWIGGLASGTNVDLDEERMAQSAILAFEKAIKNGITDPYTKEWSYVPLRAEHRGGMFDLLGYVKSASVDADHNLWIQAELDPTSSHAMELWAKLNRTPEEGKPLRIGFSVAGKILSAGKEWIDSLSKFITTFYEIALGEISVTSSPANPTAYAEALVKSLDLAALETRDTTVAEGDMSKELTIMKDDVLAKQAENADAEATDLETNENASKSENESQEDKEKSVEEAASDVSKTDNDDSETDPVDKSAEGESAVGKGAEKSLDEAKKQLSDFTNGVLEAITALTSQISNMCYQIQFLVDDHEMVQEQVGDTLFWSKESDLPDLNKQENTAMDEEAFKQALADLKDELTKGFADALTAQKDELEKAHNDQIQTLTTEIETLKSEPVAKGLANNKDKVEGDGGSDIREQFRAKAANLQGREILKASLLGEE